MADIKQFIEDNNLKQVEIARFLGITEGSVSKMVKGLTSPSQVNLQKLLDNDRGWGTSALTRPDAKPVRHEDVTILREENKMLRARVEELVQEKERLWTMVEKLTQSCHFNVTPGDL